MAFKFVILSCLMALARASVAPVAAPLVAQPVVAAAARLEEFDTFPQYNFGYNVADALTGDYKTQTEQRDGDLVRGRYTLVDSDSTLRIVDYTADSVNGFNAVVRKEPLAAAPAVVAEPAVFPARLAAAPAVLPARIAAAPAPVVAARYTAPVGYAAAAAPVPNFAAYTAPFARYAYPAAAPVVAV